MSLQTDLKWIHREIDKVKDPIPIAVIKNMLKYNKRVLSERISTEQYNKEIDASIAQIETGQTYTHLQMEE